MSTRANKLDLPAKVELGGPPCYFPDREPYPLPKETSKSLFMTSSNAALFSAHASPENYPAGTAMR